VTGARSSWAAVVIAVAAVAGVIAVIASLWAEVGNVEISTGGWIALAFGVLVATALGVGLMALVFFSARQGYDDQSGGEPGGDHC
jgi:hypothetical protein